MYNEMTEEADLIYVSLSVLISYRYQVLRMSFQHIKGQ